MNNKNREFAGRDPVLNRIVAAASDSYPDGMIALYWSDRESRAVDTESGDTLALFAAIEISECCEGLAFKEGLEEAARKMREASEELAYLANELEWRARKCDG
jgi:hypothetical protein